MAECVHESMTRRERRSERHSMTEGRGREGGREGENCIAGGIEKPAHMSQ